MGSAPVTFAARLQDKVSVQPLPAIHDVQSVIISQKTFLDIRTYTRELKVVYHGKAVRREKGRFIDLQSDYRVDNGNHILTVFRDRGL